MSFSVNEKNTIKFIADHNLEKVARWLRFAGINCDYMNQKNDKLLKEIATEENRIILTTTRKLKGQKQVLFLETQNPIEQLKKIFRKFPQINLEKAFTRCSLCNAVLISAEVENVWEKIPPGVRELYEDYFLCPDCQRIYWPGSQYKLIRNRLDEIYHNKEREK
ncbi:MAG: Mut7-C RNAse domain-containing protein [Vulcanimicrobiota bacterium]